MPAPVLTMPPEPPAEMVAMEASISKLFGLLCEFASCTLPLAVKIPRTWPWSAPVTSWSSLVPEVYTGSVL